MRKETVITVSWKRLDWNLDVYPYRKELIETIIPIEYSLPKDKALEMHYSSGDSLMGDIVSIEEFDVETFFDKLNKLLKFRKI